MEEPSDFGDISGPTCSEIKCIDVIWHEEGRKAVGLGRTLTKVVSRLVMRREFGLATENK